METAVMIRRMRMRNIAIDCTINVYKAGENLPLIIEKNCFFNGLWEILPPLNLFDKWNFFSNIK
jgi:hypothetical protein